VRLEVTVRHGLSVISEQYSCAPLKILRPFSLPDGTLLVQLLSVGPGMLAHDHYDISVQVDAGAKLLLVNQAACKVLTMQTNTCATQTVTLSVAAGGHLEYYPGTTLPYPSACLRQTIDVHTEAGATFGLLETWATGRIARGETNAFQKLESHTTIFQNSTPIYRDALWLEPDSAQAWGVLENYHYVTSGYWLGQWGVLEPVSHDHPDDGLMVARGIDVHDNIYLRALARDNVSLKKALYKQLQALRQPHADVPWEVYSSAF
jgi:urease accessory protein